MPRSTTLAALMIWALPVTSENASTLASATAPGTPCRTMRSPSRKVVWLSIEVAIVPNRVAASASSGSPDAVSPLALACSRPGAVTWRSSSRSIEPTLNSLIRARSGTRASARPCRPAASTVTGPSNSRDMTCDRTAERDVSSDPTWVPIEIEELCSRSATAVWVMVSAPGRIPVRRCSCEVAVTRTALGSTAVGVKVRVASSKRPTWVVTSRPSRSDQPLLRARLSRAYWSASSAGSPSAARAVAASSAARSTAPWMSRWPRTWAPMSIASAATSSATTVPSAARMLTAPSWSGSPRWWWVRFMTSPSRSAGWSMPPTARRGSPGRTGRG